MLDVLPRDKLDKLYFVDHSFRCELLAAFTFGVPRWEDKFFDFAGPSESVFLFYAQFGFLTGAHLCDAAPKTFDVPDVPQVKVKVLLL